MISVTNIMKDLTTPRSAGGELESYSASESRRIEQELARDIREFLNEKGFHLTKVKVSQRGKSIEV